MHVTDIQISNPTYRQTLGEFSAMVSLSCDARDVRLLCNVPAEEEQSKGARRLAFIRDALRQLRRMPEIRTGREEVSFAPGILPNEG
ncbi:hypothetical protein SAMN04488037_11510 [Shimia marina]|uniref:Uncharacterized protein n=2 Tax=Roseobacteraceae TaxID=2854170 RepID=A0A0P1ER35_9RHOB|nr:hypothetical protein SHM7688_02106 [Shimia marina]SFE67567.1 hypothetical protein SAMN04488037_11510 [Shimia marina]